MSWIADNSLFLMFLVFFLGLLLKGPMLAKAYGVRSISVHELARMLPAQPPPLLVDVRTLPEFSEVHIRQAVSTPLGELRKRTDYLRQQAGDRPVVVICRSGNRSLQGAITLKRAGFPDVLNVMGGMVNWEGQGYPVKR